MNKNNIFIISCVLLSALSLYKIFKKNATKKTELNNDPVKFVGAIVDNNIGVFTRLNDR